MIGIIGAMKIEVEAIEAITENKSEKTICGIRYVSGTLHGKDVVMAVCGIGKVAAAICTQTMILEYSPECIINTGVAGSLSVEVGIGDIVVADRLVQHDMDTSPIGDPLGLISGLGLVYIPADADLNNRIIKAVSGCKVVTGTIASGDQFIADPDKKAFIVDNFGAMACEMEGAAIGQTCCQAGVPVGVVRAISDCADGSSHMDYTEFLPMAAKKAADIIENFVKSN